MRETTSSAMHATFRVGIVLKGIDGVLQIAGAVLLLLLKPGQIRRVVAVITRHALSRNPHDVFANALIRAAENLSVDRQLFASLYLLLHGAVKVVLVWALLKSKLWAYPAAILIFAAFSAYQVYQFTMSHSMVMVVLTVLDVIVIALTWAEYSRLRHHGPR